VERKGLPRVTSRNGEEGGQKGENTINQAQKRKRPSEVHQTNSYNGPVHIKKTRHTGRRPRNRKRTAKDHWHPGPKKKGKGDKVTTKRKQTTI